jgi:molecular chaperone GrpE
MSTEPEPDPSAAVPTAAEWEQRWRQVAADLENLRKRHTRQMLRERDAERDRVVAALLPLLDNLDLALEHAEADPESIVAGVRAVRDQAVAKLAELGYPKETEVGVPFDPSRHEVVGVVDEPEVAPGTVVEVVRPGYGHGQHQLRPQAVTVSRYQE